MDTIAYVLSYLDICENEYLINELFSNKKERLMVRNYWISQSKVEIDKNTTRTVYVTNGKLHRIGGPAIECADGGNKFWYVNDKRHRLDGPAVEYVDGGKSWYANGKLHKTNGPAVEYANGRKEWYCNGKLHRLDGPAIEYADGRKGWYVNGTIIE